MTEGPQLLENVLRPLTGQRPTHSRLWRSRSPVSWARECPQIRYIAAACPPKWLFLKTWKCGVLHVGVRSPQPHHHGFGSQSGLKHFNLKAAEHVTCLFSR